MACYGCIADRHAKKGDQCETMTMYLGSEVVVGSAGSFRYYQEEDGTIIQHECYGSRCYRNGPVVIDENTLAYWRDQNVQKSPAADTVQQHQVLYPDEHQADNIPSEFALEEHLCADGIRDDLPDSSLEGQQGTLLGE